MGTWFWLNIARAVVRLLLGRHPLWLTLTGWNAEISAKRAAIAAKAGPASVFAQTAPAVMHETGSPAYAGVASPLGR